MNKKALLVLDKIGHCIGIKGIWWGEGVCLVGIVAHEASVPLHQFLLKEIHAMSSGYTVIGIVDNQLVECGATC